VKGNRTELWGRIVGPAELRSTPSGIAVLRIAVDCGADGDQLVLTAVITGGRAREASKLLKPGLQVRVAGQMRSTARGKATVERPRIELVAETFELLESPVERDD